MLVDIFDVTREFLWFLLKRDSEHATCLIITLNCYLHQKDRRQLAEYLKDDAELREWIARDVATL